MFANVGRYEPQHTVICIVCSELSCIHASGGEFKLPSPFFPSGAEKHRFFLLIRCQILPVLYSPKLFQYETSIFVLCPRAEVITEAWNGHSCNYFFVNTIISGSGVNYLCYLEQTSLVFS